MASTLTGLNQRGSRWYLNIVVPPDLRAAYGKRAMNIALGTSDRRAATLLGTVKRAEWLAAFEAKRSELNPSPVDAITPDMAALLAERTRAVVLGRDDNIRADLSLLADIARVHRVRSQLSIPDAGIIDSRIDDLSGATEEEREALADLNAFRDGKAAVSLAGQNLAAVLPLVQAEAAKLGVSFDVKTPGARGALLACLKAYRTAHKEVTLRDTGEVIDTPMVLTAPKALKPAKPRTLRDVFDKWKTSGDSPRSADSIGAYERALKQFEGQQKGLALAAITREVGDTYRTWLRENCTTPKTARDRLTAIKSLLKYAHETLEWLPKQPWRGLDIKAPTTNKRRPWTTEELKALFAAPLHTAYALPDARYGGREAAYWIPLLGLFTGTRLGELCQLKTADVQKVEGIDVLVLTNEGEGQSIKSDAGHRSVPIHSELIRLGFLTYVEAIRKTRSDSLWPSLPLREGKPSDLFGRWFKDHRNALGLTGTRPDFHCFRHTVRAPMRRAGFSEATQDKVTGHKIKGSIGTVVYDHWTLKEVQEAVEAIQYPALRLPVVAP
ncbi:site-specific tyrosine recombinase XerC [Variovorax sp. PBS-H4]|uniref:site-specific integrase n=1 Tax=Variovorax sp. PBS-H4 TaxID=434008 RepID=UPI001318E43F|nr:site-specific integrase [Variovorax sp. PBS-H4]VTU35774.1 site-specific tyrosine recombinase XerC [Variovorax sp. PBS-H4]